MRFPLVHGANLEGSVHVPFTDQWGENGRCRGENDIDVVP